MMNAPADRLAELEALLPGLESPSVIPLAHAGHDRDPRRRRVRRRLGPPAAPQGRRRERHPRPADREARPVSPTPASMAVPTQPTAYAWEATDEQVAERYGVPLERVARFDLNTSPAPPDLALRLLRDGAYGRAISEYPPSDYRALVAAAADALRRGPRRDPRRGRCRRGPRPRSRRPSSRPAAAAVVPTPTYAMYRVLTEQRPARPILVPRRPAAEGYALDLPAVRAAAREAALVWLCSPNNPTALRRARRGDRARCSTTSPPMRRAAGRRAPVVVLDEAYAEFVGRSLVGLRDAYPRLVVVRTASKAYALAGMRVGLRRRPPRAPRRGRAVPARRARSAIPSVAVVTAALRDPGRPRRQPRPRRARARPPRRRVRRRRPAGGTVGHELPARRPRAARRRPARSPTASSPGASCRARSAATTRSPGHLRFTVRDEAEDDRLVAALADLAPAVHAAGAAAARRPRRRRPDDDAPRQPRRHRPRRPPRDRRAAHARDRRSRSPSTSTGAGRRRRDRRRLLRPPARPPSPTTGCSTWRSGRPATSRSTSTTRSRTSPSSSARPSRRRSATGPGSSASARPRSRWTRRSRPRSSTSAGVRTRSSTSPFRGERVGALPTQLVEHALEAFARTAGMTLHLRAAGRNDHHVAEAAFKALARALRAAVCGRPAADRRRIDEGQPRVTRIAVVDYGAGNLVSIDQALAGRRRRGRRRPAPGRPGRRPTASSCPGVGAAAPAMARLGRRGPRRADPRLDRRRPARSSGSASACSSCSRAATRTAP